MQQVVVNVQEKSILWMTFNIISKIINAIIQSVKYITLLIGFIIFLTLALIVAAPYIISSIGLIIGVYFFIDAIIKALPQIMERI